MPLNDLQIKRIKPTDKKQTLSDGGGLALVVNAVSRGGTKYFVYNYRFDGKQQSLRIGKYPDIGWLKQGNNTSKPEITWQKVSIPAKPSNRPNKSGKPPY